MVEREWVFFGKELFGKTNQVAGSGGNGYTSRYGCESGAGCGNSGSGGTVLGATGLDGGAADSYSSGSVWLEAS